MGQGSGRAYFLFFGYQPRVSFWIWVVLWLGWMAHCSSVVEHETAPVKNKVRRFSGSAASGESLCGSLPFWQGLPCQGREVVDWRAIGKRSFASLDSFLALVFFWKEAGKRPQILDMAHLG